MDHTELLRILSKLSNAPETKILSGACDVEDIGDGFMNHVLRIRSRENPDMTVVVKHSPSYHKFIPDQPLPAGRINLEFCSLNKFDELHPGCVPKPYVLSNEHSLVIMEDLHDYKTMRKALMEGEFHMEAVKKVAETMAILHRKTHRKCVSAAQFTELVNRFKNDEMLSMMDCAFFTFPLLPYHKTNQYSAEVKAQLPRIYGDQILQENASKIRARHIAMKQCLVHGDFTTEAVMVKKDSAKVKIIDAEFAYIGPAAHDVGTLLANYIFSYYSHKLYPTEESPGFYKNLEDAMKTTLSIYLKDLNDYLTQMKSSLQYQI
ncbi:methylthioribose kinase-like isoform X2 [Amphiura filiformis]|uniref:methylthioribose kinase-like isoform X2 n=1 Tax=Amphiura filiformis TaxID=82378 RepID=UPI003B214882